MTTTNLTSLTQLTAANGKEIKIGSKVAYAVTCYGGRAELRMGTV